MISPIKKNLYDGPLYQIATFLSVNRKSYKFLPVKRSYKTVYVNLNDGEKKHCFHQFVQKSKKKDLATTASTFVNVCIKKDVV